MRPLFISILAALLLVSLSPPAVSQDDSPGGAHITQVDLIRASQIEDLPFRLEVLEEFLSRPMRDEIRPIVFRMIVATCHELKDLESATFYGEEALETNPGDVPVLLELTAAYAEADDSDADRGIRYAERAMQGLDSAAKAMGEEGERRLSTFVGSLLANWGWLEFRKGNLDVAEGMLSEAAGRQKSAEIFVRLGTIRRRAGKTAEAKDDFAMALALSSGKNKTALEAIQEIVISEGGVPDDVNTIVKEKRAEIATKKKAVMLEQSRLKPEPAPAFTVNTIDGRTVALEDMRGSVVVLDFWATWCGPCRRELPMVQQTYEDFQDENVKVLAVSVDADTSVVRPYVKSNNLTLPVAFGREVGQSYGAASIPMLVVIDGLGQLRYLHSGYHPDLGEALQAEIRELLQEL